MSISSVFSSFIKKYKDSKLVLSTHRHPDVDGIASMYALSKFLPNYTFALQDNPGEDVFPLIEKLGMKYEFLRDLNKKHYDGLVVLDCHSYSLLRDAKGWEIKLIIDHHENESKTMNAEFEIVVPDSPSNVENMYELFDINKIDKLTAYALSVGIISDTARFKSSTASTFKKLSKLIEISKSTYAELFRCAYPQEPIPKREAVLLALQRVEYLEYKSNLIATSYIGTGESTTATLLSDIADYVFIASEKKYETRISARAGEHASIPVNEVVFSVAGRLNGTGGGHAKAAGCSAKVDYKETLRTCISVLKEFIDKQV